MPFKNLLKPKTIGLGFGVGTLSIFVIFIHLYSSKSKAPPQINNENTIIQAYKDQESDYQSKITSFKKEYYNLPVANPSNVAFNNNCSNGFGGELPKIHKGMFSETLYNFSADKVPTDIKGEYAFAPYVTSYVLVGDILFKKPLDLFDRKLITQESLLRNFSDLRFIVGNKVFKNSYQTMESKFGFPQSYVSQQAGSIVSFTTFNNECDKSIGPKNLHYKKINLEGYPISSILSARYLTTLHHGVNGLFNHTDKSTDYVSKAFLEWLQSNNRAYLSIINDTNSVFKDGAYMYVPEKFENKQELVTVDFKLSAIDQTLDEIKSTIAKEANVDISDVYMVEEQLEDFKIVKFAKSITLEPLSDFAVAIKDNKLYAAKWELPSKVEIQGSEPYRSDLVLFNETAMSDAISVFKSRYQGKQLDIGTENEDLHQRHLEMNTPESRERTLKQKEALLSTVNLGLSEENNRGNLDLDSNTLKLN